MDFDKIFNELKSGVAELAKQSLGELMQEGKKDGTAFLESSKAKLEDWSHALVDGKLSKDEFTWLVQSQKDLAEMNLLKQKGLTKVRIDKFTKAVLNMVISTVFKAI